MEKCKVFGSAIYDHKIMRMNFFIDKTDNTIFSISIDDIIKTEEIITVKYGVQEENMNNRYHFVSNAITVLSNNNGTFDVISHQVRDKYNDGFEFKWDDVKEFLVLKLNL